MKKLLLHFTILFLFLSWGYTQELFAQNAAKLNPSNSKSVTTFPWVEDFEATNFPPEGWELYQIAGSSNWTRSGTAYNSTGSAYHTWTNTAAGNQETWLVTPQITLTDNPGYTLKFQSRTEYPSSYGNGSSDVYISTGSINPADGDYILLKHLSGPEEVVADWREISIPLASYAGESIYIAFKYTGTNAHGWFIDNVTIPAPATSPVFVGETAVAFGAVGNLESIVLTKEYTITNTGGQPLTVNFLSASAQISITGLPVTLEYGASATISVNFNPFEVPAGNYNGNFVLATNDPNKPTVTINVTATAHSVSTTVNTFPWVEDFESEIFPPLFWKTFRNAGPVNWIRMTNPTHTHFGSAGAAYAGNGYDNLEYWLVTKKIVLPATGDFTFSFWSKMMFFENYGSSDVFISTGSDNPADGNFVLVKHLSGSDLANTYQEISISLNAYLGTTFYIGFKYSGAMAHAWVVDDLKISAAETVINTFPWLEDFESTTFQPEGWGLYQVAGSSNWTRSGTAFNSTGSAYHTWTNAAAGNQETWLVTPKLVLTLNEEFLLKFQSRTEYPSSYGNGSSDVYISMGSKNPADGDYVLLKHLSGSDEVVADWRGITVSLAAWAGKNVYIAFKYSGNNAHGWFIDNVEVSKVESTTFPWKEDFESTTFQPEGWELYQVAGSSNWTRSGTAFNSTGSAYHTWTNAAAGNQETWLVTPKIILTNLEGFVLKFQSRIEYPSSYGNGSSDVYISMGSKNPADGDYVLLKHLSGSNEIVADWREISIPLAAYAGKNIYIAFKYSGTNAHGWFIDDVEIPKVEFTEFPWLEDFEATDFQPAGWELYQVAGATNWTRSGTGYVSTGSAYHTWSNAAAGNQETWLVTPKITLTDNQGFTLKFQSKTEYPSSYINGSSDVYISNGSKNPADGDYILLKHLSGPDEVFADWGEISIPLGAYAGKSVYFAFKYTGTNAHGWYIDDVKIPAPATNPIFNAETTVGFGAVGSLEPILVTKEYAIKNTGGVPLAVSLVSSSPAISISGLPQNILPNETKNITVSLNPEGLPNGAYNGNFMLATNDPLKPAVTIHVTATAYPVATTVTAFPWTEGFENEVFPPLFWKTFRTYGTVNWTRMTAPHNNHNESAGSAYAGNGYDNLEYWMVTKKVVLPASGDFALNFWSNMLFINNYGSSDVFISTGSDNPADGDFVLVKHLSGSEVTLGYQEITIPLNAYLGTSFYIGFKYSGAMAHAWLVDDLKIFDASVTEVVIDTFPWVEDFEAADFPSEGWGLYQVAGASNWTRSGTAFSSTGSAYHTWTNAAAGNQETWLVTPKIILSDTEGYIFKFQSRIEYPSSYVNGSSDVFISTGSKNPADGNYILLKHLFGPDEIVADWREISIPLTAYAGQNVYIAFKYSGSNAHGWFIDNVTIPDPTLPPVFEGETTMAFGTVSNVEPTAVTKPYTISNTGGLPLTVSFVSSSSAITVSGLPATLLPNETKNINVSFNPAGLPIGAFNGNFVLATNDPLHAEVTVAITADIVSVLIFPFIYEDFNWAQDNFIPLPNGWISVPPEYPSPVDRFQVISEEGIDDSGCARAGVYGNWPTATAESPRVSMGSNPILSWYYRAIGFMPGSGPAYGHQFHHKVQISNNEGATWNEIFVLNPSNHVYSYDYAFLSVDVSAYANQICKVRFVFGNSPGEQILVYLDNITIGTPPEKDLAALSIVGNDVPTVGEPSNYFIEIKNNGWATQTDYTVRLMKAGGIELASLPGVPIAYTEKKQFTLSWTPNVQESTYIYGEIVLVGDEKPEDNTTANFMVNVQQSGMVGITIGTFTEETAFPYVFPARHALTQTLYFPKEIGTNGGKITSLIYKSNFVESVNNKNIKVWIGETTKTDLLTGFINPSNLTLVYDGTVSFTSGPYLSAVLPLQNPYTYNGGNLVIYSSKADNQIHDAWFCGTREYGSARSRIVYDDYPFNANNPTGGEYSDLYPVTTFMMNMEGMASLSGVVNNGTSPLDNATIKLNGTPFFRTTGTNGNYQFPYLAPGSYAIEVSRHGYVTQTINNIVLTAGANVTQNITLVPLDTYTVSGKVMGNNAPNGLEGVKVTLSGYATFSGITNSTGDYSISGVYGVGEYDVTANVSGYSTYKGKVNVVNANTTHNITLNELAYPVVNPKAEIVGNNALVSWGAPEQNTSFRYDSGIRVGQLGFGYEYPKGVIGSCHRVNAVLYKMSWFISDAAGFEPPPVVDLYVFSMDAQGRPTNIILFTAKNVPTTAMEWNEYVFSEPVNAPNGFFIALGRPLGPFLSLGTAEPTNQYPFVPNTHYYTTNYTDLMDYPYLTIETEGFQVNPMIRAEGAVLGKSTTFGHPYDRKGEDKRVTSSAPLVYIPAELVVTDEPEINNYSRALTGYTVYRLLQGQPESSWTMLSNNVTGLNYSDNTWSPLSAGVYQFAVKANYTNGVLSLPKLTNELPKDMEVQFTVNITTNSGDPVNGAVVTLSNANRNYKETATGSAVVFSKVWKDIYDIKVVLDGFTPYRAQNISIQTQDSHRANLIEIILTPYDLKVDYASGGTYQFTWKIDPESSFDDFESYESFIINNIGNWKTVDLDLASTYAFFVQGEEISWPHFGEPQAFMVFDPSATHPPVYPDYDVFEPYSGDKYLICWGAIQATNNDWLISPELDFPSEFTFSFWAKAFSSNFAERIRVAYSTSGNNPDQFTNVVTPEPYMQVANEWTQYRFTIPEYAKHVAINCVSYNAWALLVDDVYIGMGNKKSSKSFTGFKVFLDDMEQAMVPYTEFPFSNVPQGNHTAGVIAQYTTVMSDYVSIPFISTNSINESDMEIQLYPNPFTNEIHVNNSDRVRSIQIMNYTGQKVKEMVYNGKPIPVTDLPDGMYFITVETITGNKTVYKMVKQ